MTSWGTVTLADEPGELLMAFAAHHIRLGAAEVHIFLDRPNARLARRLSAIPRVLVRSCDDAFWKEHGPRPKMQTKRQDIVANIVYGETQVEWLAHIDADEFIHPSGDMLAELAALPDDIVGLRIPVRERVWRRGAAPKTIFDGVFRRAIPGRKTLDDYLVGEISDYTQRGLVGHTAGKTMARTGVGLFLSIHAPLHHDILPLMYSQTTELLHFDGLTPFHWLLKRLRYATLPHASKRTIEDGYRWRQIAALREMASIEDAQALRTLLTTLSSAQEARFRALHIVGDADGFDPAADLAALLPGDPISLSVRRFDQRIQKRDHDLIDALALTIG